MVSNTPTTAISIIISQPFNKKIKNSFISKSFISYIGFLNMKYIIDFIINKIFLMAEYTPDLIDLIVLF